LIIAFWKVLKAERPDVIHLHSLSFFPMAVLHTFRKIPVIYTEHCAFTCVTHPLWTRVLWAMARRRVSRIVAVSGHTGSELSTKVRVAPSTVEVIYNAVDVKALDERRRQPTPEHPHLPANRPIIGGIGRLVDGKGWNLFLATAKRILAVRRDVIFAIVGEGPIEGALKCRAESMCIASNVRFLGHQDGGDMIRRFDVLLFTSEYEQLPTVLLEAFALRTPVVGCVPRGGTREILAMSEEPVGAFEATRDPRVLAAAVLRFLSDGLFSQSCTEAAYRLVAEKFDVEHTGTRLSALYRDLAAGSLGRVSANRPPAPLEPDCRR
jgi:glycosyltransferase involved in cell wall biosynthesis